MVKQDVSEARCDLCGKSPAKWATRFSAFPLSDKVMFVCELEFINEEGEPLYLCKDCVSSLHDVVEEKTKVAVKRFLKVLTC